MKKVRTLTMKLDFLDAEKVYKAEINKDGNDADADANPLSVEMKNIDVKVNDPMTIELASR
jgi:alpha-glucosidase